MCWCSISYDAIFATVTSIAIFTLGHYTNVYQEKKRKKNEVERYREVIFTWIYLIKEPIERLINELNDLSNRILNSDEMRPEVFHLNKVSISNISDIGIDKFINIFVSNSTDTQSKNNAICIYNIICQIDFLICIQEEIKNKYNEYFNQVASLNKEYNDCILALNQANSNNFTYEIKQIVSSFENSTKVSIVKENYIDPLMRIHMKSGNNSIFKLNQDFDLIFAKFCMIKKYDSLFSEIAENISKSYNCLLDYKKQLENTRVVCVCKIK